MSGNNSEEALESAEEKLIQEYKESDATFNNKEPIVEQQDKNTNANTEIDPIEEFYRHQQKQRELQNKLPLEDWVKVLKLTSSPVPKISSQSNEDSDSDYSKDKTDSESQFRSELKYALKDKLIDQMYNELLN